MSEESEEKGQRTIVCARADFPLTVRGATFRHRCTKCSALVMMAPTGEQVMAEHPDTIVICVECFKSNLKAGAYNNEEIQVSLSLWADSIRGELNKLIPNPYRQRN